MFVFAPVKKWPVAMSVGTRFWRNGFRLFFGKFSAEDVRRNNLMFEKHYEVV